MQTTEDGLLKILEYRVISAFHLPFPLYGDGAALTLMLDWESREFHVSLTTSGIMF